VRTLELKNFGEGEDLSDGEFSSDQNRFLELINYRITNRRRIQRRPPVVKVAGDFGANTLGLTLRDGQMLTMVPRGVAVDIGTPTGVNTLAYDEPTGAISSAIEDADNMGDTVLVLMRHEYASGVWGFSFHVFDSAPNLFTYTTDPAFPWWHTRAASSDELPRVVITTAASKVWMTGPDGNTHSSGVAAPRKWNHLTLVELLRYGQQFHFYNTAAVAGTADMPVPINYLDLQNSYFTDLGKPVGNFRIQEYVTAGDISHDDAFREDRWADANGEVGKEYNDVLTGALASNEWWLNSTPNTAAATTYADWVMPRVYMKPGRWYRLCWTPPNLIGSHQRFHVQSGVLQIDRTLTTRYAPSTYQFLLAGTTQLEYELDSRFVYTATPEHFEVRLNGVILVVGADYTLSQASSGKIKLTLVAAPTLNDSIEVRQFILVTIGGGVTHSVILPPGKISVDGTVYDWTGAELQFPAPVFGAGQFRWHICIDTATLTRGSGSLIVYATNVGAGNVLVKSWTHLVIMTAFQTLPGPIDSVIRYDTSYLPTAAQESAHQDAQDYAGATANERDTTILPTASHDSSGGMPTLLHGVKNRLLVCYGGSKQLWAVNEDANADEKLTVEEGGTGDQATPHGVRFAGGVMVPLVDGYNLLSLAGEQSDKFGEGDNVGDKIERFGVPNVLTAVYWPKLREYVAAEVVDGEFRLRVLDLHHTKAGTVTGWSRWTLEGITSIDYRTMRAIGDRLYFRSGTSLYYIDGGAYDRALVAGTFRDTNDTPGAGNAYLSRAVWRFNDFKKPGVTKDVRGINVVQTPCGLFTKAQLATAEFRFRPYGPNSDLEELGPTITGSTYGKDLHELSMETDHLSVVMESTDELGHELQALAILFDYQEES
jgi:hypothetical protein